MMDNPVKFGSRWQNINDIFIESGVRSRGGGPGYSYVLAIKAEVRRIIINQGNTGHRVGGKAVAAGIHRSNRRTGKGLPVRRFVGIIAIVTPTN